MADTKYPLSLTGEQIDARLQLIDGDNSSVRINANKITTTNSTLVTQADLKSATESNDGLMTAAQVAKLNSIEDGATNTKITIISNGTEEEATNITIIASTEDPGEGTTLASGTLYFVY